MRMLSSIIRRIGTLFKSDKVDNYDNENTQDDEELYSDEEYIAEMSYRLLKDGSVDIRFSYNNALNINNTNAASVIGELLFHINNGTYITQSTQSLKTLGSDIEHYAFINQIMASWASLDIQIKDSPIIKPSEVGKSNMPYQQQIQEEM